MYRASSDHYISLKIVFNVTYYKWMQRWDLCYVGVRIHVWALSVPLGWCSGSAVCFRRAVSVIASTQSSLWKWIQRAITKQKLDNVILQFVNPLDLQSQGAATIFILFFSIPSLSTAATINLLQHPDCSVSVHLYSKTC